MSNCKGVLLGVAFLLLFAHIGLNAKENRYSILNEKTQQLVVVITENEQATQGKLSTFTLAANNQWQAQGIKTGIVVGRTGIAWGQGLHPEQSGNQKVEGDGKAPAGVFRLGDAFGYLSGLNTQLKYTPMTANDYCMDVVASPLYNQIVSTDDVGKSAVKGSSEPMRRDIHSNDHLYKKGIVVHHNPNNIAPNGSCIFMHIWRASHKPTAGCTAMPEKQMDRLLAWLDASKQPVLVTLTKRQYQKFQSIWDLPKLELF
ncbi:L,D-transpeptidase family protein [Thalassotalea atypica]|uniref:L,D-transpeptidase family protein n=1 Tax=Thalassotalea atypica TaxID=2054316 RepID=UPI0025741FE2|nr:L,D-transpeptidase family protein [Thalassotalea atypica]